MHRSRFFRNPAMYNPRGEPDPQRFVYCPNTRSTYKRNSTTPFSPSHKREVAPYSTKHPVYGNPRFVDRSKYVWTANKQQPSTQTSSTNSSAVQTLLPSIQPSSQSSPVTQASSTVLLPQVKQTAVVKQTPPRPIVPRNNGKISRGDLSCLKVTALDLPNVVAADIASKLREKKVYIIKKVVDVLGVKKAIKLYYETREKEANGGILIQNGRRRRTPGGVYLTLLRESTFIPKQEIDKVFLEIKRHESKLKIAHYQMF